MVRGEGGRTPDMPRRRSTEKDLVSKKTECM